GSEDNPFLIETPAQLDQIRNYPSAHFKLNADIEMAGYSWLPIGGFRGSLDGAGFKIRNLTINLPNENNVGLFGSVSESARLVNISLVDVEVSGNLQTGALVGHNEGRIERSFASGHVTGYQAVGGLVGLSRHGHIIHSCADVEVVGGVSSTGTYAVSVGGLVGDVESGSIEFSCATGNVTKAATSAVGQAIGGLAGSLSKYMNWEIRSNIINSYATGNVVGTTEVGGLVGSISLGEISNSYARGAVTAYATGAGFAGEYVGGLAGYDEFMEIENMYGTGKETCTKEKPHHVFGLVGWSLVNHSSDSVYVLDTVQQPYVPESEQVGL